MALNDEMEKLHQAEEWLTPGHRYSLYAWEHICWVLDTVTDSRLRAEAERIALKVDGSTYLGFRRAQC